MNHAEMTTWWWAATPSDRNRAVAPLRPAGDAVVIDSTTLQAADVVARMRAAIDRAS